MKYPIGIQSFDKIREDGYIYVDKGYAEPYLSDKRKLYKVGVNFSSESGTVDDWKVI
jgi:hypothetical protein